MKKSPLALVKDRFNTKKDLLSAVDKLKTDALWVDALSEEKGLTHVSNKKLLRLHERLTLVKEQFGSREKLIAAILKLDQRSEDAGYKSRLEAYTVPRLLDLHSSATRRAKARAAKASEADAKPAKAPAPAKAATKKAAARKVASA